MPAHVARSNATRGRIRSHVEPVFAEQKRRFDRVIRTIGKARATIRITLTNLAYNCTRLAGIESSTIP
jgi:transposase